MRLVLECFLHKFKKVESLIYAPTEDEFDFMQYPSNKMRVPFNRSFFQLKQISQGSIR